MKKIILEEQVKISGIKNFRGEEKLIDFYIEQPGQDKLFVFSKVFTQNTYNLCKSGVRVNELSCKKTRNKGVMRLVNYLNVMLPYLTEYYELPKIAC